MNRSLRLSLAMTIAGASLASTACGPRVCADAAAFDNAAPTGSSSGGNGSFNAGAPAPQSSADANRAIAEADVIQIDGDKLYAMSKSGGVAIVDVSQLDALKLLGKAALSGQPFEMYRRGDILLAMSNGAVGADGTITPPPSSSYGYSPPPDDPNASGLLTALDVHDPTHVVPVATFVVSGEIADSRIVGNVLYLATYENTSCYRCGTKARTLVTSFDVSDATSPKKIDQVSYQSDAPDAQSLAWGMAWKRSILATDTRLYVGGHADFDPSGSWPDAQGVLDVLDITDPGGKLASGAHLTVAGAVLSRWQMDESNGVLRVVSQPGAGLTGNGTGMPQVQTFTIQDTQTFTALGKTTLALPRQEGLRTVRFDGTRAYAITFNQTDPLFAIDLSDPANPAQKGKLEMPGWMFYLEPHGDRVIGLGVDRDDPGGSLNVSLFDVSDMTTPKMLQRVAFGDQTFEDYIITNYELPEDQDRIQKAFRVFPDNLVAVPFSGLKQGYSNGPQTGASCAMGGGVQLIEWSNDTLVKKQTLMVSGNPRRAFEKDDHLVAVSDSDVSAFTLATGAMSSDLPIGACITQSVPQGGGGFNEGDPGGRYGEGDGSYSGGSGSGSCK